MVPHHWAPTYEYGPPASASWTTCLITDSEMESDFTFEAQVGNQIQFMAASLFN